MEVNRIVSSVKVGESYKNRSWSLKREDILTLIPTLSYEKECDIIVDNVLAKARFNIEPRIFFNKNQEALVEHLYNLSKINKNDRIQLEMLLNHELVDINIGSKKLFDEKNKLKLDLLNKDVEISKLNEYISLLKKENSLIKEKFSILEEENKSLNKKLDTLLKILNDSK